MCWHHNYKFTNNNNNLLFKVAGTPILGHFLCSISLYLQNYAVVGIYKINFDCQRTICINFNYTIIIIGLVING